jgi:FdhD protein
LPQPVREGHHQLIWYDDHIHGSGAMNSRLITLQHSSGETRQDAVAVEEPLEIRIHFGPAHQSERIVFSTTMRTPVHDIELALGLLLAEGVLQWDDELPASRQTVPNELNVYLPPGQPFDPGKYRRNGYTSSACGVCGLTSITHLLERELPKPAVGVVVSKDVLMELPRRMRPHQTLFEYTGGVHAVGRFDLSGCLNGLMEDVGRHNAFDKLVGAAMLNRTGPLTSSIVVLSGRASFELVQKAAAAGVPILMAVGAPSSLAIDLAERAGLTLIGFARPTEFNIYTHPWRITL